MFDIWNCYLPFIKNYRQDFLTFMRTAQYIDNGKVSFIIAPFLLLLLCNGVPVIRGWSSYCSKSDLGAVHMRMASPYMPS